MDRSCSQCGQNFVVTDDDLAFYEKVSPVIAGVTYHISSPSFCMECRTQRLLSWRNDRCLYTRICDRCRKNSISIYSPKRGMPVYCSDCWWSDHWDPLDHGMDYDPQRRFFEQYRELLMRTPQLALHNVNPENSAYCNHVADMKNCYLVFASAENEDVLYATRTWKNKSCIDLVESYECERCYSVLGCSACHSVSFCTNCTQCSDCFFCVDCQGCNNCVGSVNLRHRQYVFFNEQLSKEEYEQALRELPLHSHSGLQSVWKKLSEHILTQPRRWAYLSNCENVTGDHVNNARDCVACFNLSDIQDCVNCELGFQLKDCRDISGANTGELCYGIVNHVRSSRIIAGIVVFDDVDCSYCYNCLSCADLFGCVGLRHKQYCILNKQYTKDEYGDLVSVIIQKMQKDGEWGNFFPGELSPFAYNETVAQEWYPLTEESVRERGWLWQGDDEGTSATGKAVSATALPDSIHDVSDDITDWTISCERTGRLFKITNQELLFLRERGFPVPRLHPDERYRQLLSRRNPRRLWDRECANCHKDIQTTYAPERPEIVYCEECYLKTVY